MDDDVGARQAAAVPMDQSSSSMVSPEHITPADISTPASSSRLSTAPFEFSSAPSDDAMPSFDPTIAAFTDMSFTRPAMPPTAGLRDYVERHARGDQMTVLWFVEDATVMLLVVERTPGADRWQRVGRARMAFAQEPKEVVRRFGRLEVMLNHLPLRRLGHDVLIE
ncbi:hypothetical protein CDD83_10826 [Cordyceps sp. RAO-2017]|nr:hypothetical protein CDD83_10826 [Cordyceps sp. RAO-2017]